MKLFINKNEFINVATHNGKMQGIPSISTSKYLNPNCMALAQNPNTICAHCYVDKYTKLYKNLLPCLEHNTQLLTSRLLDNNELQKISMFFANTLIARFESFGDIINDIQLSNYCNIAKVCKYTHFSLWTKHYAIVLAWFRQGNKMPNNMTLILSSPLLDQNIKNDGMDNLKNEFKKYHKDVITFTVTSDKNNPCVNCGGRQCVTCRNCYDKQKKCDVVELLK